MSRATDPTPDWARFSTVKNGDSVRVFWGTEAHDGIVEHITPCRKWARVRFSPSWSQTVELSDVQRMRLDDADKRVLRASIFGALA